MYYAKEHQIGIACLLVQENPTFSKVIYFTSEDVMMMQVRFQYASKISPNHKSKLNVISDNGPYHVLSEVDQMLIRYLQI